MTAPIPFRTLRYRCPHCPRTGASKARVTEHIGRCWLNPAAKGCKTCRHYKGWEDGCGCEPGCNWGGDPIAEHCRVGVDLAGRPACKPCGGRGETFDLGDLGASECHECGGDGAEIKPGPIVGCDRWEPAPRCQEPTCPDFGDPDFGEGTCPAEHAEPAAAVHRARLAAEGTDTP